MSTKHTPGPWDVNEFTDLDGDRHIQVCCQTNDAPIAHVYENGSETRPNAHILSAALAMRDALDELVAIFPINNERDYRALVRARAALDEAKGAQS